MKKILLSTLIATVFYSCSSSKESRKYFSENNIEISKSVFDKSRFDKNLIAVKDDSLNREILTKRELRGKMNDLESFYNLLETDLNYKIDKTKPIVIIYYIDKDPYNSGGGFVDKKWIANWKNDLERGLNQIAGIKPIYLYKKFQGLKQHEGIIPWQKDPENQVGQMFFKHNYPWLSFVVISTEGNYISRFGEFTLDYVWEATQIMNE